MGKKESESEKRKKMIRGILARFRENHRWIGPKAETETFRALKRFFHFYDKNSDGKIDFAEFESILEELGIPFPDAYRKRLFKDADIDGSGAICKKEFAEFILTSAPHGMEH